MEKEYNINDEIELIQSREPISVVSEVKYYYPSFLDKDIKKVKKIKKVRVAKWFEMGAFFAASIAFNEYLKRLGLPETTSIIPIGLVGIAYAYGCLVRDELIEDASKRVHALAKKIDPEKAEEIYNLLLNSKITHICEKEMLPSTLGYYNSIDNVVFESDGEKFASQIIRENPDFELTSKGLYVDNVSLKKALK